MPLNTSRAGNRRRAASKAAPAPAEDPAGAAQAEDPAGDKPPAKKRPLKKSPGPKGEAFVREYLKCLNATEAVLKAGYNCSSRTVAKTIAGEMLRKPVIKKLIAEGQARAAAKAELSIDEVHAKLAALVRFDPRKLYKEDGSFKLPHEWDDDTAAAMAGAEMGAYLAGPGQQKLFLKKAKFPDPVAAATVALRRFGLLRDRLEVETKTPQQSAQEVRDAVAAAMGTTVQSAPPPEAA